MLKNRFVLIIFLFILSQNKLLTLGGSKEDLDYSFKQFNSIIFLTIGANVASESKDFFNHYNKFSGSSLNYFKHYPLAGIGTKFQFWNIYRIGLETELNQTSFIDSYDEQVNGEDQGTRSITQDFQITSIPALFLFEYNPKTSQFRTYAGIGAGALFSRIKWRELLVSTIFLDKRQGGFHYDEMKIYPCGRLYAGLELGFDKNQSENFVGSLIIELKYTFMNRSVALFSPIKDQFQKLPEGLNDNITILPGYVGLYFGMTFNFNRRKG